MGSRLIVGLVFLLTAFAPVMVHANSTYTIAKYAKSFKVPVTYYDYHVDGSNPDFGFRATARWNQADSSYKNYSGWADSTLTADRSPQRAKKLWIANDTFLDISWNLAKLFKPWVAGVKDTFVWKTPPEIIPPTVKDTTVDTLIINGTDTVRYFTKYDTIAPADTNFIQDTLMVSDTLFKNIVIPDSVTFTWVANTETEDTADSLWSYGVMQKMDPLAGKGFGDEATDGFAAGYTFALHNKFTYHGKEVLTFGADDDAYVFINGKLAMECGGFHEAIPISLSLDSLHLTVGQKYDIDIFYVERRMGGNVVISGIYDFETRGPMIIDTAYDTVGVIYNSGKNLQRKGTVLGLRVPPSSQNVKLEYFSLSGAKLMDREMPVTRALANQAASLPKGMYLVRVTFLNAQGVRLSVGALRQMIVRK